MPEITPADAVKAQLAELTGIIKSSKDEMNKLFGERDAKLASLEDEKKKFGTEHADTKAKLAEVGTKLADSLTQITKAHEAIDKLTTELRKPGKGNADDKRKNDDGKDGRKDHIRLAEIKHWASNNNQSIPFDASRVAAGDEELYTKAAEAVRRSFRMNHHVAFPNQLYSADEAKAISTISHGNQMWLPLDMVDMIIECFEAETDLSIFFNHASISGPGMQFMRNDADIEDGSWECEMSCAEADVTIQQPGVSTIMAHNLRAKVCVTNNMIDDAAFDIEGYIAQKVAEGLVKTRNRGFMTGSGNGMPHGILKTGNHLEMNSGSVAGTPSGDFSWQDLSSMKWKHPVRFHGNRIWFMDRDAAAATMTMADGQGRPLWSEISLAQDGLPSLLGLPVFIPTQMPKYLSSVGAKVVGSKPIALGNWQMHYQVVERAGMSVLRDPYSRANCNAVVWHFQQRVGGDVLCPEAAVFMKIV